MKASRRARRMGRHHRRGRRMPGFNMISLMDIFTILVFFLLVNSSEVEVLPSAKGIDLPESIAEQRPRESVVVMITGENILLQGREVVRIDEIQGDVATDVGALRDALGSEATRGPRITDGGQPEAREVTIMGDRSIPYALLKKVMLSCTRAGYSRISLSVIQKAEQNS